MAKELTAIRDKVVVKPIEAPKETPGGILLPDSVQKQRADQGVITAVGGGHVNSDGSITSLDVEVGDAIFFSRFGLNEIDFAGEKFFVVAERDILSVVKDTRKRK